MENLNNFSKNIFNDKKNIIDSLAHILNSYLINLNNDLLLEISNNIIFNYINNKKKLRNKLLLQIILKKLDYESNKIKFFFLRWNDQIKNSNFHFNFLKINNNHLSFNKTYKNNMINLNKINNNNIFQNFLIRQNKYSLLKNKSKEKLRQDNEELDSIIHSFNPKINQNSNLNSNKKNVHLRLYNDSLNKNNKNKNNEKKIIYNHKNKSKNDNIYNDLYDEYKIKQERIKNLKKHIDKERGYTFSPKINKYIENKYNQIEINSILTYKYKNIKDLNINDINREYYRKDIIKNLNRSISAKKIYRRPKYNYNFIYDFIVKTKEEEKSLKYKTIKNNSIDNM